MLGLGEKGLPSFLFLHVFADGFGAAPHCNIHLRNLLGVPNVGHVWAVLQQSAICFLPTRVLGFGIEFPRLAPGIIWCVAVVCRGRSGRTLFSRAVTCD